MGKFHSTQHFGFGQFVCFGFHHHHGVFGAGHNQIKTLIRIVAQIVHVIHGWVQHIFTFAEANAATGNRPHEWRAGNRQRGRGGDHGNHVWIIDQIVAQHGADHQNFVLEAGHEQRTDRTVDQAAGQGFFFGGTCLTLEETTGDLTGSIVFLVVMHGQRKEILTGLLGFGERHVGHDRGFTQCRNDRTIGLTGNLARFQCKLFFAPLHRLLRFSKHISFLMRALPTPVGSRVLHGDPIVADPNP